VDTAIFDKVHPRDLELRRLLVPIGEHPAGALIDSEMSLAQIATEPLPLPWGMVWNPASCENYLAMAMPGVFDNHGWLRATDRRSKAFSHDNFYLDMVIEVPGGTDVQRIGAAAGTCKSGTLTLDDTVTGKVTYTEVETPELQSLERATSLTLRIEVSFAPPKDRAEAATLAKYHYGPPQGADALFAAQAGVSNVKTASYVATGDALVMVLSPDARVATEMAAATHGRALASGLL
jgi:hypothetical protein